MMGEAPILEEKCVLNSCRMDQQSGFSWIYILGVDLNVRLSYLYLFYEYLHTPNMKGVFRSSFIVNSGYVYQGWILMPEWAENMIILMLGDVLATAIH